jgi:hypothetical protein
MSPGISEQQRKSKALANDRCELCGARIGVTKASIREIAANVVCAGLLVAVLVPTWLLVERWTEEHGHMPPERLLWQEPLEEWSVEGRYRSAMRDPSSQSCSNCSISARSFMTISCRSSPVGNSSYTGTSSSRASRHLQRRLACISRGAYSATRPLWLGEQQADRGIIRPGAAGF